MATIVSRSPKLYFYDVDGLRILTPRRPGETFCHKEVVSYEVLTAKQKKLQKQKDAVKRRLNSLAERKIAR